MRLSAIVRAFCLLILGSGASAAPVAVDWTKTITEMPDGTFVMGDPDAPVKLVELASLTCPHCASFDAASAVPLAETYIKPGKVSYAIHNFVRDPYDMAAALIARCGGPAHYYPMTHAILAAQPAWLAKMSALPQDQLDALQAKSPEEQLVAIGQATGLQELAAQNGVSAADTARCLADTAALQRITATREADLAQHPDITGVPAFIINGKLVEGSTWPEIEPKLQN